MNGISLGGYIAALVASLDEDLTCAILGVPPANLVSILGRHAGLSVDDPRHRTLELAAPIGDMISPLSLQPKVAPEGRFIYAASPTGSCTRASRCWDCGSTGGGDRTSAGTAAGIPGFSRPVRCSNSWTPRSYSRGGSQTGGASGELLSADLRDGHVLIVTAAGIPSCPAAVLRPCRRTGHKQRGCPPVLPSGRGGQTATRSYPLHLYPGRFVTNPRKLFFRFFF